VLAMGELPSLRSVAARIGGVAVLALILSGVELTFSRSGVVISMIGIAALYLFALKGARLRFTVLLVPAVAIALAAGTIGGVSPTATTERVSSGFSPTHDQGNQLRTESINKGFEVYGEASLVQQAIGRGVASTGNAQQLVEDPAPKVTVESYYLKLLVETGVVGLLLIGGFLVWAAITFALSGWKPRAPWTASVGAAGLGLSLYNVIYPALETQVLALAWWLLLVICLAIKAEPVTEGAPPEEATVGVAAGEPAPALSR
jgi:O-Antigen ligase